VTNAVTLGKGVALVSFVFETEFDVSNLTEQTDVDMYHYVKEIYDDLKKNGATDLLVFPSTSCSAKESILMNNDRFFIGHTLIEPFQKNVKHDRLVKHLNNCYACFQVYSQFYKDYFQADQEIRRTLANKN
jgi:hypothetical protein